MNAQMALSVEVVHAIYAGIHALILASSAFLQNSNLCCDCQCRDDLSQESDHNHELILMP